MVDAPQPSRHVAFAERFAADPVNRLSAFAAVERARILMREAKQVEELFQREGQAEDPEPWWWQGLEIVPYTLVGLVTCLEFHGRSRATDHYSYRPDTIGAKHLDGKVHPRVLSQMIKANVSIPQFLGASFTIGSTKEYLTVFDDLFDILGIDEDPAAIIQTSTTGQIGLFGDVVHQPSVREQLDELFATRHAIVHEIGMDVEAGRSHCDLWPPSRVVEACHLVVSTITAIERVLTERAPKDFPNLLNLQGYPIDERGQLAASIAELEASIGATIASRHAEAQSEWTAALSEAQRSVAAHEKLFQDRRIFQQRHPGQANGLSRSALRLRLALLTQIAAELAKTNTVSNS